MNISLPLLRPLSLLGLALAATTAFAFEWRGSGGSDFSSPANWSGAAPTPQASNQGDLVILNGSDSALVYTEACGRTSFDCVDFKIGNSKSPGGSLLITGGELTIVSFWSPTVGHNNNQSSTLTLTGGKLVLKSRSDAKARERSVRVGNDKGTRTHGSLNLTGGILEIACPGDIGLGGLVIANSDASGEVNLGGGLLVVTSIFGSSFQPSGGRGVGMLTFGPGDGVFMQTDSKHITFGTGGGESSYINFLSGSAGQLSLAGAKEEDFRQWVLDGKIRIDGRIATPDRFRYLALENQGVYLLAPAK